MYLPAHFKTDDLDRLDELAAHDPFATLVTIVDGEPFATHLPVMLERAHDRVMLRGHWARPNAQWKSAVGQRALCIIHGPHAYVSPNYYPDPDRRVPTWNYATAHLRGPLRLIEEPQELLALGSALSDHFESGSSKPWSLAAANRSLDSMAAGIVGFEMSIEQIDLKFKMNQNHPIENAEGVARAFQASDDRDAQLLGRWMQADVTRRRGTG